nr:type 1 glutamine amidotransferase domain-containing protein [Sciscionella marina]
MQGPQANPRRTALDDDLQAEPHEQQWPQVAEEVRVAASGDSGTGEQTAALTGKRVAFLTATEGVEQVELVEPWRAVTQCGGTAELLSVPGAHGQVQAFHHLDKADTFAVDNTVDEVEPQAYDALVLPGGVANPDALRMDDTAVAFVREFFDRAIPVAAICHAPWVLAEADVVRGRRLTSWPSLCTDLRNAGATWVDEEAVLDGFLLTSRKPDDLPVFSTRLIDLVGTRLRA